MLIFLINKSNFDAILKPNGIFARPYTKIPQILLKLAPDKLFF
jgi:hypothetical protein